MHVDILVAEIGSTTTMVNAFNGVSGDSSAELSGAREAQKPRYLGQGLAPTSVEQGDVRIGLDAAVADLSRRLAAGGAGESAESGL
ncbi:MAG: glutamate mutase L, partial [Spirochaetota bacterium]